MVPKVVICATRSLAVLFGHIPKNLVATVDTEVHIDIRQTDPFHIEEPFEDETVFDGIEIGNPHHIGHQAPRCGTAPRPHRNAALLGVIDEIGNDEKIGGKPHLADDFHLVVKPLLVFGFLALPKIRAPLANEFQTLTKTIPDRPLKALFDPLPVSERKDGKVRRAQLDLHVTLVGNGHGVLQGIRELRQIRETSLRGI